MSSPPDPAQGKIAAIQAARAIAALTVVVVHLTSGFAYHIDGRLTLGETGSQLASGSVALFFMISGAVMVLSAERLFGTAGGMVTFWRRRMVRILPPYWICTFLLLGVAMWIGLPYSAREVASSLVFVPQPHPAGPWSFKVFLWPGWTLFYELVFYAVFGACVILGRVRAVLAASVVLAALVVIGREITLDTLGLHAATRPVLLLFVPGMAIGLLLHRGFALPGWLRWASLAAALAALVVLDHPERSDFYNFGYLWWAGVPALLVLLATVGGPLRLAETGPSLALGDASYAIYLLHIPFAHAWMQVFNVWLPHPGGSLAYLGLGLPMLIALSLGFYRYIERPTTDRLNALLGGRPISQQSLDRSIAP